MKLLAAIVILTFSMGFAASGQYGLNVGQTAPDWTVTDINGTSHQLYDYLDQGYKVIIEMGATWCGPCWQYHQAGVLKQVYQNHGPAGMPGVNTNTTNSIMVIFLEADTGTGMAQLDGTGNNTTGNWIEGTPYPIVNLTDNNIQVQYQLQGFPSAWLVCPDRIIERFYYAWYFPLPTSMADFVDQSIVCPYQTPGVDAGFKNYSGAQVACGPQDVMVALQNQGTQPLTATTMNVAVNGLPFVSGFSWTGNLAPWQTENVNFGPNVFSGDTEVAVTITSNDANQNNNTLNHLVEAAPEATTQWNIYLRTDCYGFDTSWEIKNEQGNVVASGGAYASDTEYNLTYYLPTTGCHTFYLYDSFGDGMYVSNLGIGGFCEVDGACHVYTSLGTIYSYGMAGDLPAFAFSVESDIANVTNMVWMEESTEVSTEEMHIYPNPSAGVSRAEGTLANAGQVSIAIFNMLGERVTILDLGVLPAGTFRTELDLTGMEAGLYLVQMTCGGEVIAKTIMRSK